MATLPARMLRRETLLLAGAALLARAAEDGERTRRPVRLHGAGGA